MKVILKDFTGTDIEVYSCHVEVRKVDNKIIYPVIANQYEVIRVFYSPEDALKKKEEIDILIGNYRKEMIASSTILSHYFNLSE